MSAAPLRAFAGYGLELEYMIVDRESLAVKPIADALLQMLQPAGAEPRRFGWSNELVLHLLEVKNIDPRAGLRGLARGFQAEVGRVNDLLEQFGARLMPGGMHPWMDPAAETKLWPHRDAAIYAAYDRIFDCRAHGWANIQSAQLNLAFADDAEFARLHAAVRLLLPILPALAASSPIADGRARAELDYRMECYRVHPSRLLSLIGHVIPDDTAGRADYEASVLAPMYADVAPLDPEGVLHADWLNARGAIPRFERSAIEIRVVDMQECPQADLAVAALTVAAARALYEQRWAASAAQRGIATETLAAILLACIRDAERAVIDDAGYLGLLGFARPRCEARDLWIHLFDQCAQDAVMSQTPRAALGVILNRGPLARRLLRAAGDGGDRARLAVAYRELCDCLAAGRLFMGPAP